MIIASWNCFFKSIFAKKTKSYQENKNCWLCVDPCPKISSTFALYQQSLKVTYFKMKCVYMPIKYLINWYEETNMTGCVSIMSVFQDKIFWITDGVKFWRANCSGGNFSSVILVFF